MKEGKFEKEYDITGKDLTPERKEEISAYLEGRKNGAMKPIEGEYLKTPEELKAIKLINKYLNEEFEELGIKEKVDIKPEQIHLLPKDIYNKVCSIKDPRAVFGGLTQGICIDKDSHRSRLELYNAMLHESIHAVSFLKFRAKEKDLKPSLYRVGYHIFSKKDKEYEYFHGLNEIITDVTVVEILKKHREELVKEFKISEEEQNEHIKRYPTEVLETIIKKIADKNNEDERNIWLRFKKRLFTGEMMHLREVERIFGKGSLRVLATYRPGTRDDLEEDREYHRKMLRYLKTDDEKERKKIADEILIEREKEEYKRQRE